MPRRTEDEIYIFAPGTRSRKKPNRSYVARIWIDGKRVDKAIEGATTEEQARSAAAEYLGAARSRAAQRGRPAARPETFRELSDRYAAARQLAKSERSYLDKLVAAKLNTLKGLALGDVPLADLTPALAQEAAGKLYAGRTAKTMNRAAISPFSAAIHFAAENQWLPYMKVKGFKAIERMTPRLPGGADDACRLLAALAAAKPKKCDRYKDDHPYRYLLVLIFFRQGFRISETLAVKWKQIDLVHGVFRDFKYDKGDVIEDKEMQDDVFEAFAALPEGEAERAAQVRRGRVFPWVNRHNVYRWLKPFLAEHAIPFKFTPHQGRVEFASELSEAGVSTIGIRDVGSWKDHRAVARYTRTSKQTKRAILARLGQAEPDAVAQDLGEGRESPGGKTKAL